MEYEKNIALDDKCTATLTVKISKEEIKKEYDGLLKRYSKELALPGFRKGKVPVSVLQAKYSKAIQDDLHSQMVQEITDEVFKSLKPEEIPMFPDEVQFEGDEKFTLDADYSFALKYEVRPEVKIVKDEGFTLKVPAIYVSDEDIQKELELIQERNALIKDRGDDEVVKEGDLVSVDYQAFDGDTQEAAMKDYTFTQSKASTQYVFEDDVLGMKKGETKEIVKTYGEDCRVEYLKGKTRRISLTVKTIKEKNLPALDDELAQDVGEEYKTLEDLKKDIKAKLEQQIASFMEEEKKKSLLAELVKENPVYISESLVMKTVASQYKSIQQQYNLTADNMKDIGYDFYKLMAPKAIVELQGSYIMAELIKRAEIKLDEEACDAYVQEVANENNIPLDYLNQLLSDPSKKERILYDLKEKKVLEMMYTKSTFEEGEKISFGAYLEKR